MTLTLLVCLFVVNARLFTIKRFGVQEPFMDSFSELVDYKAVVSDNFAAVWQHSFELHNEHRIVLTRWTNVALFMLNRGKWDLIVQACLDAILAGLCVGALFVGIGRFFDGLRYTFFALLLALTFGLPISYENILWGFQSQHFYFILFSTVAICGLLGTNAGSAAWWFGLVAGLLACLTVGSGFYALLAVVAGCAVMTLRPEFRKRSLVVTAATCLLLLLIYLPWILGVKAEPQYQAHSFSQFLISLCLNLSWPNVAWYQSWCFLIIQLPSFALAVCICLRHEPLPKSSYIILGLGIWNLLIILALAYLRGAYTPHARYYDYNAFCVVLNGAALLEISRLALFPHLSDGARIGIFVGWTALVMAGCCQLFTDAWNVFLPQRKSELIEEQFAIRDLFRTNDATVLTSPHLNNVFPFTKQYAAYTASELQDPKIYPCLPNSMKPGLDQTPDNEPMSRLGRLLLRRSDFVLAGVTLALAASLGCSLCSAQINRQSIGSFFKAITP